MAFLSFANISSQRVRKEEKAICNSRSCLRKCNSFVPLQVRVCVPFAVGWRLSYEETSLL